MSLTYLLSILSYHLILSCTFIYILILFIYGTFVCFNIVLFMYCTFICLLPVLVFFIFQFYVLLPMIKMSEISADISPIFRVSGATETIFDI